MDNTKKIPEKRFPEFRDDGEWNDEILKNIGDIVTGKTPSTLDSSLWNGDVLFITPTDIDNNEKYQNTTSRTVVQKKGNKILPVGTVIYTCIASIGKIAITTKPSITNQQINSIIVSKENNNEFMYYSLVNLTPFIKSRPATSTLPIINKTEFSGIKFNIPSPKEQIKIAECLSSVDEIIEGQNKKLKALQLHKKALLQNLFPLEDETKPKFRFPEFKKEDEWVVKKFKDIAIFLKGKGISKADIVKNGEIPCIRYGELYTRYKETIDQVISFTNLPTNELIFSKENDVIIPASGETQLDIATASCVLHNGIALGGDLNIIRSNNNGVFLSYYLNNAKKFEIASMAQGNAVVHLYAHQLKTLNLLLPKIEEQQKIASCLSSIDGLITEQQNKIEQLKLYKKGLMQVLFPQIQN